MHPTAKSLLTNVNECVTVGGEGGAAMHILPHPNNLPTSPMWTCFIILFKRLNLT